MAMSPGQAPPLPVKFKVMSITPATGFPVPSKVKGSLCWVPLRTATNAPSELQSQPKAGSGKKHDPSSNVALAS